MNILEELTAGARERIREAERRKPFAEVRREAEAMERGNFPFERALRRPGLSFICECKRASPSRGLIAAEYPCVSIAKDYEAAGADAVLVGEALMGASDRRAKLRELRGLAEEERSAAFAAVLRKEEWL